jgi:quercetin dioxygenase-like cupin family protein
MQIHVNMPVESLVIGPLIGQSANFPVVAERADVLYVSGRDLREKLEKLTAALFSGKTIDLPVKHHFSRGVYARELFIPKGTVLVGKIHKFSQINIVLKGDISVLTEDGVKRVKAGETIVSPAGIQRAGYAHEDTVWTTIHGTHETALDRLEDELIAASFEDYDAFCATLAQGETSWLGQS